jgi:arylsulfatase A-like enzyme
MCVVWPGLVKPGSVSDVPAISTDFYPTIAAMAGIPRLRGAPRDGVSLVPTLRGGSAPKREALFWHYPHYSNQGGRPGAAIRMGDWKLIRWYEGQPSELYNLARDPGEKDDLAAREPEKARDLAARLETWLESMNVDMPAANPDYDPERQTEGLQPAIREQLTNGELPGPR